MSDENKLPAGSVAWIDLTVSDAPGVRDFYKEVVGWDAEGCQMDGYEDFNMMPGGTGQAVAGICHAKDTNAGMPASWHRKWVSATNCSVTPVTCHRARNNARPFAGHCCRNRN